MTLIGNYDAQEVEKFNTLAEHWWDTEGKLKTLHHINPMRTQFIKDTVNLKGKKVLDVGCGGGILTEALAEQGANVKGIDMAEDVLTVAKDHAQKQALNIDYQHKTVEILADEKPGTFDVITCMELLEHVPEPQAVIQACSKLLKPGGHAFFSTINRTFKAYLLAIVGAEYLLRLIPLNTHQYNQFIKPSELTAWARASDLNLKKLKGLHYNPLTHQTKLTPDVAVNYIAYFSGAA